MNQEKLLCSQRRDAMSFALTRLLYGARLTHPSALSSRKIPLKMTPSLMPEGWKPFLVMSPVPPTGFLRRPKWYWPCPLTSFLTASPWALRGSLPVE